jgi:integrase
VPPDAPLAHAESTALTQRALPIAVAAEAADRAAARAVFDRYRAALADETRRRQDADLACFTQYLTSAGASCGNLTHEPVSWSGISWGLVEAFVAWQLQEGYAVGSINVRLSTVKSYAKLAFKAGALSAESYAAIKVVSGYRHAAGRRVDKKRETTRVGSKKAEPVSISPDQARQLKGAATGRDRLLLCLLLDHGLRVGEVAILEAKHFNLRRGVLRFYRPKVDEQQQHRLSTDTAAAATWIAEAPDTGPIFPGTRRIAYIVEAAGRAVGLDGLSPHDCRHYWATAATRAGTPLKALQDAGGWSSPAMPLRYVESAEIANDGVQLD